MAITVCCGERQDNLFACGRCGDRAWALPLFAWHREARLGIRGHGLARAWHRQQIANPADLLRLEETGLWCWCIDEREPGRRIGPG